MTGIDDSTFLRKRNLGGSHVETTKAVDSKKDSDDRLGGLAIPGPVVVRIAAIVDVSAVIAA